MLKDNKEKVFDSIWESFSDLHKGIDSLNYKEFLLIIILYRYLSEDFESFMNGGEEIDYANMSDSIISPELKDDLVRTKGYYIAPENLFVNVSKHTSNICKVLNSVFKSIEDTASYHSSEDNIKGLLTSVNFLDNKLGSTIKKKDKKVASIIKRVKDIDINEIGSFSELFDFLISKYASISYNYCRFFFTPTYVSKLMAELAISGLESIDTVYDSACGSGSSLIQFRKYFNNCSLFGQEINKQMYNLARMNMLIHDINYTNFDIGEGDVHCTPKHNNIKHFDIVVSHFPYSQEWTGEENNSMPYYHDRYKLMSSNILAPKSKADYAFILHNLNYLSDKGRAVLVCFPGIFIRGGSEKETRKYLIESNYIEAIIALPYNLFYNSSPKMNLLLLSKNKRNKKVQFIKADKKDFFKEGLKNRFLTDKHIKKIVNIFKNKKSIKDVSIFIDNNKIAENNYNLSVEEYLG